MVDSLGPCLWYDIINWSRSKSKGNYAGTGWFLFTVICKISFVRPHDQIFFLYRLITSLYSVAALVLTRSTARVHMQAQPAHSLQVSQHLNRSNLVHFFLQDTVTQLWKHQLLFACVGRGCVLPGKLISSHWHVNVSEDSAESTVKQISQEQHLSTDGRHCSKPGQCLLAVHSILTMTSCCFVTAQKAFSVLASLPLRALVKKKKKKDALFAAQRENNDAPQNKTVLTNGSQGPVTVRGTVPGCNYWDNSCLIIQWGEEPSSPIRRGVGGSDRKQH